MKSSYLLLVRAPTGYNVNDFFSIFPGNNWFFVPTRAPIGFGIGTNLLGVFGIGTLVGVFGIGILFGVFTAIPPVESARPAISSESSF